MPRVRSVPAGWVFVKFDLDGVCHACLRAVPITRTTQRPEGITCLICQEEGSREVKLVVLRLRRLATLDAERQRLLRRLGAAYTAGLN